MSWRPSWWFKALKFYWPLNQWAVKSISRPILGPLITYLARPFFTGKSYNITYLPIQAKIDPPVSTILTEGIIGELIRRSAHRVIIKRCTCRDSNECKKYPIEDSCLMLGEDTQKISPEIGTHVSVEEALDHLHKKISLGLIPMTGRVRLDDLYYGVPNHGRMLTICFCCPCCCSVLRYAKYLPQEFHDSIVPLEGIKITYDSTLCVKCGSCQNACFLNAISIQDGVILREETRCIGCGRCSSVCSSGALRFEVEDCDAAINELLHRISERVNVE